MRRKTRKRIYKKTKYYIYDCVILNVATGIQKMIRVVSRSKEQAAVEAKHIEKASNHYDENDLVITDIKKIATKYL